MKNVLAVIGTLSFAAHLASSSAQAQQTRKPLAANNLQSIYTSLAQGACKLLRVDEESGSSSQRCPGVAGYRLLVEDSDSRMSVTIITPNGKNHPLNYWHTVTPYFSALGDKAEWRVAKKNGRLTPLALIVRVNANENPEAPSEVKSYLAVAKITNRSVCVTDKISAGTEANAEARRAADASAKKPCLEIKEAGGFFSPGETGRR